MDAKLILRKPSPRLVVNLSTHLEVALKVKCKALSLVTTTIVRQQASLPMVCLALMNPEATLVIVEKIDVVVTVAAEIECSL